MSDDSTAQDTDASAVTGILFSASDSSEATESHINTLVEYDFPSGQMQVFFHQAGIHLVHPVAWSPSGRALAVLIYGRENFEDRELCLLNRQGVQEICFEERPPYTNDYAMVTWSADETKLIHVAADEAPGISTRRLVESDTRTGKRLRTLLEYPNTGEDLEAGSFVLRVNWTNDLSYVGLNLGMPTGGEWSKGLLDMASGEPVPLWTLAYEDVCPDFSPDGRYLTAIVDGQIWLLDLVSQQAWFVTMPYGTDIYPGCPMWGEDESYFIYPQANQLIRYNLMTFETQRFATGLQSLSRNTFFSLSPDGAMIGTINRQRLHITLFSPEETTIDIAPYRAIRHFLWFTTAQE